MAFTTPSLLDIWTRTRNAMRAYLPGTDAWIEPNNLSVVGRAFSLIIESVYERVNYLYRQLFASSADGYHLEYRHAFELGLARKPSAPAIGYVSFQQTAPFATIPAGYNFTAPNGVIYAFLATAVPDGNGNCTVQAQATTNGAITNQLPNTPVVFAANSLYPSMPGAGTVGPQGMGGGADVETDDELRARVLLRKQAPPHGGSASDYEQWALEVPGVTRCFVSPFLVTEPTQAAVPLTIYPLFDDTRVNGVPTAFDLLAVAQYIDPLRPVTSRVYLAAARPTPVNVQISNLQNDSPTLRASITKNLTAMIFERCPVVTASNAFTLPTQWIGEAIARSTGYVRSDLVQPQGTEVAFTPGQLPILGNIDFGS
jgi:uncharacterized phage protein gp47/JayE